MKDYVMYKEKKEKLQVIINIHQRRLPTPSKERKLGGGRWKVKG